MRDLHPGRLRPRSSRAPRPGGGKVARSVERELRPDDERLAGAGRVDSSQPGEISSGAGPGGSGTEALDLGPHPGLRVSRPRQPRAFPSAFGAFGPEGRGILSKGSVSERDRPRPHRRHARFRAHPLSRVRAPGAELERARPSSLVRGGTVRVLRRRAPRRERGRDWRFRPSTPGPALAASSPAHGGAAFARRVRRLRRALPCPVLGARSLSAGRSSRGPGAARPLPRAPRERRRARRRLSRGLPLGAGRRCSRLSRNT